MNADLKTNKQTDFFFEYRYHSLFQLIPTNLKILKLF